MLERIRVASLQYFIRPVRTFEDFEAQVEGLVNTAADYKAHLLVFPEYFTLQLLTLSDVNRPIASQVRELSRQEPRFREMMSKLSKKRGLYIVAGTIPVQDNDGRMYNDCHVFAAAPRPARSAPPG